MLRLVRLVVIVLLGTATPLLAQESIQQLGSPTGPSSGETPAVTTPTAPAEGVAPANSDVVAVPAPPPPCGTQPITIARMQWPSAALLAEIHSRLLTANFLCNVSVQDGDLATTGSSMGATGQPAVAPELWISRIADIWNAAMQGDKVRQAGTSYTDAIFEGWFVPDYAVAKWPDLATADGLKAHAAEFSQGGKPGRFISCPIDWGCAVVNRNLLRAYGLDQSFEVVEPANRFEMDTLIAEAVGRKQPIAFYYWQPNAVLSQFSFQPITLAPYDHDAFLCMGRTVCGSTTPTGFAPDPVVVALAEWVYTGAPQVAAYFGRARMPFAEMNRMLQQLGEPGATVESVADRFVTERGEIWRPWVGLPEPAAPKPQ